MKIFKILLLASSLTLLNNSKNYAIHNYFYHNDQILKENETVDSQLYVLPLVKTTYIKINTTDDSLKDKFDFSGIRIYQGNSGINLDNINSLVGNDLFSIKEYTGDYKIKYENTLLYDSKSQSNNDVYIDGNFPTGTIYLTIESYDENILSNRIPVIIYEPLPTYSSLLYIKTLPTKVEYSLGDKFDYAGLVVNKLTYTSTVNDDTSTNFNFNVTITSNEVLTLNDLEITSISEGTTGSLNENNEINSMGSFIYGIGQKGFTSNSIETWDPQATYLNFFVIIPFGIGIPNVQLQVKEQPTKLTYYKNEVYSPEGIKVVLAIDYNDDNFGEDETNFYVQLIGYTTTYLDKDNNVVTINAGDYFTNLDSGKVTLNISFTYETYSYSSSYDIEFLNEDTTITTSETNPTNKNAMLFSLIGGIGIIVVALVGLFIHILLNKKRIKKADKNNKE